MNILAKPNKALELFLLFMLVIVPLVYSGRSYNMIYIKETAAALALLFMVFSVYFRGSISVKRAALYPVVFIAWMGISLIFSGYKYAAAPVFIKAVIFMGVFFIASSMRIKSTGRLREIIMAASVPAVAAGVMQAAGAGFMNPFMEFGKRLPSTLGNPNFFGAYLVALFPVAVFAAIKSSGRERYLPASLSIVVFFLALMTGSKAVLIGLGLSVMILLRHFLRKNKKTAKFSFAYIILCAAVFAAALAFSLGLFKQSDSFFDAARRNESIFFRTQVWKGTLKMIADNPVTGKGFGSFSAVFPEYRPDELMLWSHEHSYEVVYPENILLQLGAEGGIPAVLIFLALLYAMLMNRERGRIDFLTGFFGLMTVNLFSVDINYTPSLVMAALYAGILINGKQADNIRIKGRLKKICVLAGAALLVFIIIMQFRAHVSDIYLREAVYSSKLKDWKNTHHNYERALENNVYNVPALYFRGIAYADEDPVKNRDKSLEFFGKTEKLAPYYVLLHYRKGKVYRSNNETERAVSEYREMLKTDPYYKPALTELAYIYYSSKQKFEEAEKYIKKAIEKYKNEASLYNNLGNIYFMAKRITDSINAYKKAIDLKEDKDYYYNLGCVYFTLNDPENARLYLEKARDAGGAKDQRILKMLEMVERYERVTGRK